MTTDTMLAAVCEKPGAALELKQVPIPEPKRGQLLVKLESCGVCHSDLSLRNGEEELPDELYPLVLGHEGIGRVVESGGGTIDAPQPGARVGLPWLYNTCLDCKPCLGGNETFCQQQTARGVQHHGAFAEFALVDALFACTLPEDIDPVQSAPLLCAGLTAWSALKKTQLSPASTVLVIGAGGLGQYAVLIAKICGATVFVLDQDQGKLDTAATLGADQTFLSGRDTGSDIKRAGGADIVLNFAPSNNVWSTIETAANPMSEIVAIALVHKPVDLSMMWLINGGHRVFGSSVGSRQELREFLPFSNRISDKVHVEKIPFREVNNALDRMQSGDFKGRMCIDFNL